MKKPRRTLASDSHDDDRIVIDFDNDPAFSGFGAPPEVRKPKYNQRFSGSVREVATNVPGTTDRLVVTMLEARLGKDDRVLVSGDQPPNPAMGALGGGEAPIATISFEPNSASRAQFWLFRLTAESDQTLLKAFGDLKGADHALGLALMEPKGAEQALYVQKVTLLNPSIKSGIVGRRTNLTWNDPYGHEFTQGGHLTQDGLADVQMYVSVIDDDLALMGQNDAVQAVVSTRATQDNLDALAAQQQ